MKQSRLAAVTALLLTLGLAVLGSHSVAQEGAAPGSLRERIRARMAERQQGKTPAAATADLNAKITQPGDYNFSFPHDGIDRAYRVHVPSKYDPDKATPVLISMHGGGGNMDYQASEENYGQISKSDKEGFIVVFPNGVGALPGGKLATWNAGACCGKARDKNVDDVGFLREMITHLTQQLNVDRRRIFATGMSNGGLMAQRLACEMPDVIRAIAPVAGTDNTKFCEPKNPISVLQIHARNDDHLPFEGGMGKKSMGSAVTEFTSVPVSIARWVKRDGCPEAPKRVLDKPGAYCEKYAPCQNNTAVELCVTETGQHSWPGASKSRGSEPPSQAISANDVMWDFFMEVSR